MKRRGFTLIEVLVAAALAATLMMLTAQVFNAAVRSRERLRESSSELTALRRAFETISRDLHSAIVPPDDSGLQFGLSGTQGIGTNVLQFAAIVSEPLLSSRQVNETALVQYAIAEDPRTQQPTLWRYETPYPVPEGSDPTNSQDARALPLLPGVTGATYLFYSAQDSNWIESWDGQAGLPTAIRIDLAFGDPQRPELEPKKVESWIFTLPAAKYANEEAVAAEAEAAAGTGTGTTP